MVTKMWCALSLLFRPGARFLDCNEALPCKFQSVQSIAFSRGHDLCVGGLLDQPD